MYFRGRSPRKYIQYEGGICMYPVAVPLNAHASVVQVCVFHKHTCTMYMYNLLFSLCCPGNRAGMHGPHCAGC